MIKKKTQKRKVKGEINPYTSKAWNRAIVDLPNISIIINNGIEDSVPPDERSNEITNEE
ncbi:MAG: hypothetical protein GTN76_03350 [Candidatus Aenigmarchaeota archaeon]|nr:hypothetical protein [Candidatus Aenigmarchaeota archaeon]